MRLRIFLFLVSIVVFYSCGSAKKTTPKKTVYTKKVVTPKPTEESKKVVEKPTPVVEEKAPEVVQPKSVSVSTQKKSYSEITQEYINRFSNIAIEEMHRYKIPASITLAQGVLESGSGKSPLALKSNNHFGIKCHKGWKGHSVSHDDDAIGECFRKYDDPEKSYEDHSKFLTSRKRYASLFTLHPTDFTGWAYGLKKAGYATDPRYPQKLISIINKYNLHQYDLVENATENDISTKSSSAIYYTVQKGDTLYSIAKRNQTTVEQIKADNNLFDNVISIGQELLIQ